MTSPSPTVGTHRALRPLSSRKAGGFQLRYLRYELKRPFKRQALIFSLALPAVLYLALFKTGPAHAGIPHGNFAAWMMIGIAVYGAATSATANAVGISIEKSSGWMRTMRLTPLGTMGYILSKVAASMVAATLPVILVGILGAVTGADAPAQVWVIGLVVAWLGSAIFAALGLGLGLAVKPEVVIHVPGITITALAFIGNLFIPLSGIILEIGRWTPMFGISTLARYALDGGYSPSGAHSSLVLAIVNMLAWFIGFVIFAAVRFRASGGRN
ncbi:ABC transporter permease [Devriesea agamarum]|uniref:ABC transporter permease n=1 Tax=Devriesea agamarum TaxID=472569 RepID=UPI00071CA37D|nr:ABC transporter permease [Devriesea agamarum]